MILSTFLLSLYSQLFLLNCQNSRDFRKPVGNFPKEIWKRSLVYSGLVYYSGTRTTSRFARAERYDYFSRDSNIILLSLCHIHKHWALTKDQPKVHFQSWTKIQIKISFGFLVCFLLDDHKFGRVCIQVFSSVDFC